MTRLLCSTVAVICALASAGPAWGGEIDPECLERLKTEGVAAWRQLDEHYDGVTVKGHFDSVMRYVDGENRKQIQKRTYDFHVSRLLDQHCIILEQIRSDELVSTSAHNPEYRFEVYRSGKDDEWILGEAGTAPDTPGLGKNDIGWSRLAWEIDRGASLINIVTRSDVFRVDEAVFFTSDDGENRVRIRATNTQPPGTPNRFDEHLGFGGCQVEAVLDPDRHWVVTEYKVIAAVNAKAARTVTTGRIEYHELEDGIPFLRRVSFTREIEGTPFDVDIEKTIELDVPEPVADQDVFFLAHYGIDDSVIRGDTRGGLRRAGWFLLGLGALALTWRLIARRAKSATDSGSTMSE